MQSLLQYRQIGIAARAQLDKKTGDSPGTASPVAAPNASDVEMREAPTTGTTQHSYANSSTTHTRNRNENVEPFRSELPGISVCNRTSEGHQVFVVGWTGSDDPLTPYNWALARRVGATLQISLIGLLLTAASGIDAAVLPQAAQELGVSHVAESLATGKLDMHGALSSTAS